MEKRLELTIAPNYVNWGVWESLRELLQNAFDGRSCGHEMTIDYDEGLETLTLTNDGASVVRGDLVLGKTDKRDDATLRGKFGEGMKLAWASLCRLGHTVKVTSGVEVWVPKIAHSETYGVELLVVDVTTCEPADAVIVEVTGIEPSEWRNARERVLELSPQSVDYVNAHWGSILTSSEHRKKLYANGFFVCELPEAIFGYDLMDVSLDRDRSIAHDWSLKTEVVSVASEAVEGCPELAAEMARAIQDATTLEARAFCTSGGLSAEFGGLMAVEIRKTHGDIVLVVNDEERLLVQEVGRRPLLVSAGIAQALSPFLPTINKVEEELARHVDATFGLDDLCEVHRTEMQWLRQMVHLRDPHLELVPVRFRRAEQSVWRQENEVLVDVDVIKVGGGVMLNCVATCLGEQGWDFGPSFIALAIDRLRADANAREVS